MDINKIFVSIVCKVFNMKKAEISTNNKNNKTVRIEMLEESLLVKFKSGQYQLKVLFIMYTDFEAILKSIESPNPNPESSCTKVINQHIPSCFCVNSKFTYGKVKKPLKLYRGEDCVKVFKSSDLKVRDHCHYTREYREYRSCNLMYKIPHYISIVFYNLSRYDAHLFIRELGKRFNTGKISVIAENKEKNISFNVNVIIDTYEVGGEVKEKKIQLRFH